jgi:hypothetical protein
MAKRHADALMIQTGACNPSGIAHSIIEACREVRQERGDVCADPAVRLMVHQLAYICKAGDAALIGGQMRARDYEACDRACREAKEGI